MARNYKLLGSFVIEENGRSLPATNSPKRSALISYLIINKRVDNRDILADLLWESESTSQSLERLRTLLKRTRKAIPELTVQKQIISFAPNEDTIVDYYQLETALAQTDSKEAVDYEQLDDGLQLYKGDLLAGFYLEDAPYFNEWLLLERERLRRRVLSAFDLLCEAYAEQQQWRLGIAAAERWLTIDDLDERPYRWLMVMYSASGNVSLARKWYKTLCQQLQDELGAEPDAVTIELAQQLETLVESSPFANLLTADELVAGELPTIGALPANAYLPYRRNPDFVGRQEELLSFAEQLIHATPKHNHPPVVAITGIGGMGKSQLAVEFSYRYGRYFSGGVYWLSFANDDNVAEEVAVIGGERGMRLYQDSDKLNLADRIGRVQRAWQESTPRLLIFDNCESETLLAEWLPVTGGCHILLTSRRAQWDRQFHVTPHPISTLPEHESISLLKKLAPRLTEDEAQQIADEVGNLPLALHLAGGFLARYGRIAPERYLEELKKKGIISHDSLKGRGSNQSPTGHELDVARTFSLNLKQLNMEDEVDEMARNLLASAACLAPGEPIAQSFLLQCFVTEDADFETELIAEDGLLNLLTLGFLESGDKQTVVMHRLLCAFTQEAVAEVASAQTAVEKRMLNQLTTYWDKQLDIRELPVTAVHLHHITNQAIVQKNVSAPMLANYWGRHQLDNYNFPQAETYLSEAFAIRESLHLQDTFDKARILTTMGSLLWRQSKELESWPYFLEASEITLQTLGSDHPKTALSLNNLGVIQSRLGHFEQAISYYAQALATYEKLESQTSDLIITLRNMGILYRRLGQYNQARECYQRVLTINAFAEEKREFWVAESLNGLGYLEFKVGKYEESRQLLDKALIRYQKAFGKHSSSIAFPLTNLGSVNTTLGFYEEAEVYFKQALSLRQQGLQENHPYIGSTHAFFGNLYLQMDRHEEAKSHLETAVSILEPASAASRNDHVGALTSLGDLYFSLGDLDTARPYLERALIVGKDVIPPTHPELAAPLISLGLWYDMMGESEKAQELYGRAASNLQGQVAPTHIDWQRLLQISTY